MHMQFEIPSRKPSTKRKNASDETWHTTAPTELWLCKHF